MLNNDIKRQRGGLISAARDVASLRQTPSELMFGLVVDAELVLYPNPDEEDSLYIWRYKVTPAKLTWAGLGNLPVVAAKDTSFIPPNLPQPNYDAFSISELGNGGQYSYGVLPAHIPAALKPVRIPDGTPVMCYAHKKHNDGSFHYIIINTQAITGIC